MATGLQHAGFYIPNAGDVSNPRMAEPDRVDFNTLAHPLWGVIEGCAVTVAGTNASSGGGTLLVNGSIVTLKPGSVGLGVGGSQDRFDLIVADAGGILTVITGKQSVDPVFPDPPLNATVLAAVFCPTSATTLAENVIDKRKFVSKALLTKILPSEDLVRNLNGTGNHYRLDGGGAMTWENDAMMWRSNPYEITIRKHLIVDGTLTAHGDILAGGDITAIGNVYGANLHWGTNTPEVPLNPGTIWQNQNNGKIYVWQNGKWNELATIESANPPGTVITSMESATVMMPLGWIPLDGRTIYETDYPSLFAISGLAHLITNNTPRSMTLPNADKLALVTDWHRNAGLKVSPHTNNLVTLQTANLPRHGHNPKVKSGGGASPQVKMNKAGSHGHNVYGGSHGHAVVDDGHAHHGMDLGAGSNIASAVIGLMWGGKNKIDALFNDRNHTYSVEAMEWTMPATSNVRVTSDSSSHGHSVDPNGEHEHTATVDAILPHEHTASEDLVGDGAAFDITPEYLTVFTYIRS